MPSLFRGDETTKLCMRCGESKDKSQFYERVKNSGRYKSSCKSCDSIEFKKKYRAKPFSSLTKEQKALHIEHTKKWRAENPDKRHKQERSRHLLQTYGIVQKEYDDMLYSQQGCCKLCGKKLIRESVKRYFSVDHNHSTGIVRGILCYNCNSGLGLFKDNPHLLERAKEYVNTDGFRRKEV
jgi:hypothetical protein